MRNYRKIGKNDSNMLSSQGVAPFSYPRILNNMWFDNTPDNKKIVIPKPSYVNNFLQIQAKYLGGTAAPLDAFDLKDTNGTLLSYSTVRILGVYMTFGMTTLQFPFSYSNYKINNIGYTMKMTAFSTQSSLYPYNITVIHAPQQGESYTSSTPLDFNEIGFFYDISRGEDIPLGRYLIQRMVLSETYQLNNAEQNSVFYTNDILIN